MLPSTKSSPAPPSRVSAPSPPRSWSSPPPPSMRQVRQRPDAVLASDRVGPAEALDRELLDRGVVQRLAGRREDGDRRRAVAGDADGVVGVRAGVARRVGAVAAVDRDGDRPVEGHARVDGVSAAERRDGHVVVGGLVAGHGDAPGGAVDDHAARARADVDVIGVLGALRDDGVGRSVAVAVEGVEVDVGGGEVGTPEVADGDGVGAAEGADVRALDAVEVHRDARDVAGQAHARAVGRDVDLLAGIGAVEGQRVLAALPLDGVAAVAGIPLEGVVAGAQLCRVGADVAVDVVVAGAAEQGVGPVAAGDRVIAAAAVDGEVRQRPDAVLADDRVGATEALDGELLDRGVVDGLRGGRERARRRRCRCGRCRWCRRRWCPSRSWCRRRRRRRP